MFEERGVFKLIEASTTFTYVEKLKCIPQYRWVIFMYQLKIN